MAKSIKVYDHLRVNHNHELITVESFPDLCDMFNWDIKDDPNAKECSLMITRELICFGFIDLSPMMQDGSILTVELIPAE